MGSLTIDAADQASLPVIAEGSLYFVAITGRIFHPLDWGDRGKLPEQVLKMVHFHVELMLVGVIHQLAGTTGTGEGTFCITFHTLYGAGKRPVCQLCFPLLFAMLGL